jgi:hypothetical protein
MASPSSSTKRTVVLSVGGKSAADTRLLFRFAQAHILEPNTDRVVVAHVELSGEPHNYAYNRALPLSGEVSQNCVSASLGDSLTLTDAQEAKWLPDEMRDGLRDYTAEYWALRGNTVVEAVEAR